MKKQREEQITDLLTRGVKEVIDQSSLLKKLSGKKKIRVKLGIDPTSPNIHIGRAVVLWKLRAFQELGHQVVLIVGDFTGQIGDTSDKEAERPMLTPEQVKANLKSYFIQAGKIIDIKKAELYYNSKWLKKLGFLEICKIADAFGLHEFASRELIKKRIDAGKRVSLRELMYPLMQGYDSVAVKADLELGGTDQRFNLLAGRAIQPLYGQNPQNILMTELLEGTDGRKMSSSWGNVINLTDPADEMFGKTMSIHDDLTEKYFLLATKMDKREIKDFLLHTKHPRDRKLKLALEITALYHGEKKAISAKERFIARFTHKELPEDIASQELSTGIYTLPKLLKLTGLASSTSEAVRLIKQGGVKINQAVNNEPETVLDIKKGEELLVQVGKRRFMQIRGK